MNPFKQWRDQLGAGQGGRRSSRSRASGPLRSPGPSGGRSGPSICRAAREWTRIHTRRWAHLLHGAAAENRAVGPVTFLLLSGVVGATLTLTTLYSTSYAVTVDGEPVGVVADQSVVDRAIQTVEAQGTRLLGYDYQVDGQVDYDFALTLKSELSDQRAIQNYFYEQLNEVSDQVKSYEVTVDGRSVGVVKDDGGPGPTCWTELKAQYTTENTVQAGLWRTCRSTTCTRWRTR